MCFSATASFLVSGATAIAAAVAFAHMRSVREVPLAAMPALFALQQATEGGLWLALAATPPSACAPPLTIGFLAVAEVLWPLLAPLAAALVEPDQRRRRMIWACLAAGVIPSVYCAMRLLTVPQAAVIEGHHVAYAAETPLDPVMMVPYVAATVLSLALSSIAALRAFALIVAAGYAAAYVCYWQSFVSVWCFFAAAGSTVIMLHVVGQARAVRSAASRA